MQYYIATIVILLLGMQLIPTLAIRCYQCNPGASTCDDPFNSNGIDTVESANGWCTKDKVVIVGQQLTSRGPDGANRCTKKACEKQSGAELSGENCCCNTNLCNSTGRLSSAMTLGIILSASVLVLKKLM